MNYTGLVDETRMEASVADLQTMQIIEMKHKALHPIGYFRMYDSGSYTTGKTFNLIVTATTTVKITETQITV